MNTHTKCADVYTHMQRFIPLESKEVRAKIPSMPSTGQELVPNENSCMCLHLGHMHSSLFLGPQGFRLSMA